MIECAICTRHPHPTGEPCTPWCLSIPQPNGTISTVHHHGPDSSCGRDCRSREADLGAICSSCAQKIRDDLDALVDSWAATGDPVFPGGSSGDGRAKSSPLPGGTDWMDWRQGADLFGVLTTWVRDWMDIYALAGPRRGDLTSITGWLRAHLDHAANSHPAIDDFADEIRKLAQRGRRLANGDVDKAQRVQCPTDDCGRWLRVNAHDPEAHIRCKACGTDWTSGRLILVGMSANTEVWLDPEAASEATGKDPSTLRKWARAGKIERSHGRYELHSIRQQMTG